ncbi:hypothetical protein LZC95_17160 [Pendulispora brunnea]|uniref:Uncharacterized protein n=1 Tax=Pendulispora brunnea TaxID=2905690 RepID=A0ABZ2KJ18_9BACT
MTYTLRALFSAVAMAGLAIALYGCSDDGDASDPRCAQLCAIDEPSLEGAYDVCSEKSASDCRTECAARLSGTTSVCAQCLLEDASFGIGAQDGLGVSCGSGSAQCGSQSCTMTGRAGSCTYCGDNKQQTEDCIRQVEPRRSVECKTRYQSVSKCAQFCK